MGKLHLHICQNIFTLEAKSIFMIFRRSYNYNTKLSRTQLREKLEGKHFDIHGLDFECMDRDGVLKIIPHTEWEDDKVFTLPITHLICADKTDGSIDLKIKFKPRRIDIGGPTIALVFILVFLFLGLGFYFSSAATYKTESLVMAIIGGVLLIIYGFRMNAGYFDYIRKIRKWVKSKI